MSRNSGSRIVISVLSASAACGVAALLLAAPLAAQRTIGGVPSGAVLVDFRVLAADGQPVADVKAEEVQVTVDGRQRVVQAVRYVKMGEGAVAAPGVPPPFGTNLVPEGQRNVMIVFNDGSIRAGQEGDVKAAISHFVSTLGPNDQVGLATTPKGAISITPTTDRAQFSAGLEKVVGRAAPMASQEDFTCDTRDVLNEMRALFEGLAGRNAPTYVLFFSAGLAAPTTASAPIGSQTRSSACELRPDSFQDLATAASTARAFTYVMQPEGLTSPLPGDEGLENLAGVTGSRRYRIGSSGQAVLEGIATETSAYYVATVGLEDVERNGQPHRLEVTVNRPNTRIMHQASLVLGQPAAAGEASTPTPRDMLRTEAQFPALPVRVGGYASRNQPGDSKLRVIAMLEPLETVELTAASAGLVSADGRLVAQWTAQPQELKAPMVFAALLADPGEYRLRMATTDSAGRAGAADFSLNVTLHQADTVQVSEAWTFSTATGQLMPALEYRGDETAMVLFELYGQPPAGFFAKAELAKTPDGPVLQNPQLQAAPGGEGFFRITAQYPMADLEPGDYVAILTLGNDPQVKLIKTIRKVQ